MKQWNIAVIAHDARKEALIHWVGAHLPQLQPHRFWATGTTGTRLQHAWPDLDITPLKSGPLGGDQQIGAMIAESRIDLLIFFIDALTAQPHDVDVKALLRLAIYYNIPFACNAQTAEMIITGPLFLEHGPAATICR